MPSNKSKLYILYGSATGNAEQIAKDLASSASSEVTTTTTTTTTTDIICGPLESFRRHQTDWATPSISKGLILICSTTGNGDPPENASRFVRYIKRKTTPTTAFEGIPYAVLGLGDTNYDQFCEAAKVIDKALSTKGGRRIQSLQCADEAIGLEGVVEPFTETIVDKMIKAMMISGGGEEEEDEVKEEETKQEEEKVTAAAPTSSSSPTLVVKEEEKKDDTPHTATTTATTTLEEPLAVSSSPLCILYGSATGNAEFIAKDLEKAYKGTYFPNVICAPLNHYKKLKLVENHWSQHHPEQQQKHALIVTCSTTGNGDIPENGDRFVRWLGRKSTPDNVMSNVTYAVLALGDTNYDQFCEAGKKIDSLLKKKAGATPLMPLTCADEATGLEDVVEPWKATILQQMEDACRGGGSSNSSPTTVVTETTTTNTTSTTTTAVAADKAPTATTTTASELPVTTTPAASSSTTPAATSTPSSSSGVNMIRQILQKRTNGILPPVVVKNDLTASQQQQQQKPTALRQIQVLTKEEEQLATAAAAASMATTTTSDTNTMLEWDRQTISTVSSSGIIYTHVRPYGSHIIKARYLTQQTSIRAAEKASQLWMMEDESSSNDNDNTTTIMNQVYDIYNQEFQLDKDPYASKRVLELTLALPDDSSLSYEPGDSLGLLVPNPPSVVQEFCHLFQLTDADQTRLVSMVDDPSTLQGRPVSVRHILTHVVDLSSPLTNKQIVKRMLQQIQVLLLSLSGKEEEEEKVMKNDSEEQQQQEALQIMDTDFTNDEWEIFFSEKYTIVELMNHFDILTKYITWMEWITILLPPQAPRYYSVSSSPLQQQHDPNATTTTTTTPQHVTIAFSVVDYTTPSGRRKGGVATRYLEALASSCVAGGNTSSTTHPTTKLAIFPKPTTDFRLPPSLRTPLVLIGPGTGIAPFIGFLQHRQAQFRLQSKSSTNSMLEGTWRGSFEIDPEEQQMNHHQQNNKNNNTTTTPIHVYFGCRHANHDYLYKEELQNWSSNTNKLISQLKVAVSRDNTTGTTPKQYVQDLFSNETISLIVNEDASVYICGDGNHMAKDVQSKLIQLLANDDRVVNAEAYVQDMKEQERLVMDIWS